MSTEAAIQKGKGVVSNPAFFIIFTLCGALLIAAAVVLLMAFIDVDPRGRFEGLRITAIALIAITVALFAIAKFSGLGEKLFVALTALAGLVGGLLAGCLAAYVQIMHGEFLWAALLAILVCALPPAVIMGERALPIFVAFVAGLGGLLSVIIFIMSLIGVGGPQHH